MGKIALRASPVAMALPNMDGTAAREGRDRRPEPLMPCPDVHPFAMRAPNTRRKPPRNAGRRSTPWLMPKLDAEQERAVRYDVVR